MAWESFSECTSRGESEPSRLLTKAPTHTWPEVIQQQQKKKKGKKLNTAKEFLPFLPRKLLGAPPANPNKMQCGMTKPREKPEDKALSLAHRRTGQEVFMLQKGRPCGVPASRFQFQPFWWCCCFVPPEVCLKEATTAEQTPRESRGT